MSLSSAADILHYRARKEEPPPADGFFIASKKLASLFGKGARKQKERTDEKDGKEILGF